MTSAAAGQLLGRGVWWADYLIRGRPVLLAITSAGECLRRVRLARDEDEDLAREWLDGLLEHYDPPPSRRLSLLRASTVPGARKLYLPLLRR
jgi:hypothetical protein